MNTKFNISEVFKTSWRHTIENIWVLVGLLVGMTIISFTINIFSMPAADSYVGNFIAVAISCIISLLFNLGYTKIYFRHLMEKNLNFRLTDNNREKSLLILLQTYSFS